MNIKKRFFKTELIDEPNKGFSLIQLLVVIAIIGILSAIMIVGINSAKKKARIADAKTDLSTIFKALRMLEFDTDEWPGHEPVNSVCSVCSGNELENLSAGEAGLIATDGNFTNWEGPYLERIDLDPWGNNYFFDNDYTLNGETRVVIGSYGPNGVGLNQYDDDDIVLQIWPSHEFN